MDNEKILEILKKLEKSNPVEFFSRMNETQMGTGAVLKFLYENEKTVTAGEISRFMHISSARMAVLLRKMEERGLIIRQMGIRDARTIMVSLTDFGFQTAEKMHKELCNHIQKVIDKVGIERIMEFIAISEEIQEVYKSTAPCFSEENN